MVFELLGQNLMCPVIFTDQKRACRIHIDPMYDPWTHHTIDPGKTVTVCQVFLLKDTTSDVTLQGKETLNVSGGQTTSQILKLK